ncbi:MAG: efflux RND transporter periplasmic adaptor subunit, partial [Magnetospirillum sp.]
MNRVRAGLSALLLSAVWPASVHAQSGFATEGAAFQAVLIPADGRTLLYLADVDTNAPVVGATVAAEAAGWQGPAQASQPDGVYDLAWQPAPAGADVTLIVAAAGRDDLLLVQGVRPPPP